MTRLLIVEDGTAVRRLLQPVLEARQFEILEANGVGQAESVLADREVDVVVTDHAMPDGDGLAVLSAARRADPTIPVVLFASAATVQLAVDAMKAGAFDFVTKPFHPEHVRAVVSQAADRSRLLRANRPLKKKVRRLSSPPLLVGPSAVMEELRRLVLRLGRTEAPVLLLGETGSGRELVARALHAASPRSEQVFVPVSCAGFPETLLESELFGHERGSFIGADESRAGVFEAAAGGTVFLDEAGDMPFSLQGKLLRLLMSGEIVRAGSTRPRPVDARLVVAAHGDLKRHVEAGQFREDLYYRLAVPIRVPSLRERKEDIPALTQEILVQIAREQRLPSVPVATGAALESLSAYGFPGNVRELRNILEHAVIAASDGRIDAADLSLPPSSPSGDGGRPFENWIASLPEALELRRLGDEVEKALILRALAGSDGVAAQAARKLGLSRSDLAYKLRRLGIARH